MTKALVATDLGSIEAELARIKQRGTGEEYTNYFRQPLEGCDLLSHSAGETVVFANNDLDFYHVFFYSKNLEELSMVLRDVYCGTPLALDYVTKKPEPRLDEALRASGFELYARFKRISNNQLPKVETNSKLRFADVGQVDQIHRGLIENLDKYTGHFPSPNRLLEFITAKQILVTGIGEQIDGLLLYQLHGKRANLNQFYCTSKNALDFLFLLKNFYGIMTQIGVTSAFGWVNEDNVKVTAMHYSFGFLDDGLLDFIYCRETAP